METITLALAIFSALGAIVIFLCVAFGPDGDKQLRKALGFDENSNINVGYKRGDITVWMKQMRRVDDVKDEVERVEKKLNALADHLGLEWQEEHTEGWVEKEERKKLRVNFDGTSSNSNDTFVFFGQPDVSGPFEEANKCHCGFIAKNKRGLSSHKAQAHK